jgi:DNA-binding response OmpR family regulator
MATLLVLTHSLGSAAEVLPALEFLGHSTSVRPLEASALLDAPPADAVVVDARRNLAEARGLCRLLRTTGLAGALLAVVGEGGLAAVSPDWGLDDVVLSDAGPAEVEARLRLATTRPAPDSSRELVDRAIHRGALVVDDTTYTCRLDGRALDLTFKEFELLKFLAQHPGRVFSRAQLLQEVWGYDYYGGTRTVDVHVRRLRAKLGTEHESLIGTVRNVGYKFVVPTSIAPAEGLDRPTPESATIRLADAAS